MKNILKLLLVLFPVMVIGQTQTENYVKTVTYKVPSQVKIPAPTITQAAQNITYFDGLGRPVQQVASQQSNSGKDIITHIKYDGFGRQVEEYLPFKSSNTNMAFDPAAEANLRSYYSSPNPLVNGNPALEATTNPFSRKELEASPLNRVLKQAAPGNDWQSGLGHEIKMNYQTNGFEEVKLFAANTTWNVTAGLFAISFANNGYYPANQLYKTITYDENTAAAPSETNGSTVEFKNKEGQIVLKRTYGTVGLGTTNEKHDTYYIYDIYGNLTYVIPPKAVDLIGSTAGLQTDLTSTAVINSGSSLPLTATNSIRLLPGFQALAGSTFSAVIDNGTQNTLDILCYQYKYDHRNRLVEKKLPGKQWEFIVYDKLDRAVATGPANSPFSDLASVGWMVTKYDVSNRPVITAWLASIINSSTRKTLQDTQNGFTANFSETKIATATNTTMPEAGGVIFRYTTLAWPQSGYHVLSVNYYDDYNFPGAPAVPATVAGTDQSVYYNNTTLKPIGLPTGTWTRVPEASTNYKNEQSYSLYDAKARIVRSYTKNFLDGYTYTDNKLDAFSGQLKYSITKHSRLAGGSELKTTETYTYSPQDRLMTQTHQIDAMPAETILSNTYDELGQLISKKVGNNTQNINYTYNIRGWLTDINNIAALQQSGDAKDLFAFKINYNTIPSGIANVKALYNGNIAETQWATNSDNGIIRSYGYQYDNLNRLKDAFYKKGATLNTYNENLTYDKNGNIITLKRNGSTNDISQIPIDNLTYDYKDRNNSNQLLKVTDAIPNNAAFLQEFKDSPSNSADDYSYDANGNMTKDNNKNITAITYNHLNLPTKITFATTGNIVYIYNAAGQKVQKIVNATSLPAVTIDYLGGYQYDNGTLKFFPTAEGYVEPAGSSYKYIYQYKDHLGNVRLSYDKTLAIKEESNFYPFGLKQEGYNTLKTGVENKYKYNGKELQDESIGGVQLNLYDYGFRNYDPALGRWMNIDPLAEKYYIVSPYTYCVDNPIFYIDPNGKEIDISELMKSKDHAKAFMLFAKTKQGITFLNNFASKGQKLSYGGKVFYEAKEAGKFDKLGIDLNYSVGKSKTGSDTGSEFKFKGNNFDVNISIAQESFGSNNKIFNLTKAIMHESFMHGDNAAKDFADDGSLNDSTLPSEYRKYGIHADHYYNSVEYLANPSNQNVQLFPVQGFNLLKQVSKSLNLNYSDKQIKSTMWTFTGSLINVNEKSGKLERSK